MISLGNLCNSQRSFLCHNFCEVYQMLHQHQSHSLMFRSCSLQTLRYLFLCHSLDKVCQILPQTQARGLLLILCWRALDVLLSSLYIHMYCTHTPPWEGSPSYHVPSVIRKIRLAWVCKTLWYFVLTFFS